MGFIFQFNLVVNTSWVHRHLLQVVLFPISYQVLELRSMKFARLYKKILLKIRFACWEINITLTIAKIEMTLHTHTYHQGLI